MFSPLYLEALRIAALLRKKGASNSTSDATIKYLLDEFTKQEKQEPQRSVTQLLYALKADNARILSVLATRDLARPSGITASSSEDSPTPIEILRALLGSSEKELVLKFLNDANARLINYLEKEEGAHIEQVLTLIDEQTKTELMKKYTSALQHSNQNSAAERALKSENVDFLNALMRFVGIENFFANLDTAFRTSLIQKASNFVAKACSSITSPALSSTLANELFQTKDSEEMLEILFPSATRAQLSEEELVAFQRKSLRTLVGSIRWNDALVKLSEILANISPSSPISSSEKAALFLKLTMKKDKKISFFIPSKLCSSNVFADCILNQENSSSNDKSFFVDFVMHSLEKSVKRVHQQNPARFLSLRRTQGSSFYLFTSSSYRKERSL